MRKLDNITCPICNEKFMESESLLEAFKDDTKTKFLSNLVRHYRQSHIRYWNKCWGPYGDKYRGLGLRTTVWGNSRSIIGPSVRLSEKPFPSSRIWVLVQGISGNSRKPMS